jgi:hypothetical protein
MYATNEILDAVEIYVTIDDAYGQDEDHVRVPGAVEVNVHWLNRFFFAVQGGEWAVFDDSTGPELSGLTGVPFQWDGDSEALAVLIACEILTRTAAGTTLSEYANNMMSITADTVTAAAKFVEAAAAGKKGPTRKYARAVIALLP